MTRPRQHPAQSPAEHSAEVARVRSMMAYDEVERRAADVVRAGDPCPECGLPVDEVNAEPLDYVRQADGTLAAAGVVVVALPCGHGFARETGACRS